MKKQTVFAGAIAIALGFGGSAFAGEQVAYTIVEDGIPTALSVEAGNVERGRDAMINRKQGNCLACHAISVLSDQPFHGEVGPTLDGVAGRWDEPQLRLILVNSKEVFEDTIMPAFYKAEGYNRVAKKFDGKSILSAQQVEDVIAFLQTLK